MALDQLVGSTTQNGPMGNMFFGNADLTGGGILRTIGPEDQLRLGDLLARRGPGLGYIGDGNHTAMPLPYRPPGGGNFIGIQPQPPMFGGLQPMPQPDYSSQFENFGKTLGGFGEQLTGFGDQMTGYQDALGSFNEQVGGMGKQFETISNRLDSVDKGLGSLGNQIASLENMQKAQPQEVRPQPQRPAFNPFNPFGFGGLGSLFGRRY